MTTELFAQRILVPDPNRAPYWNDGHLKEQQYYNLKCICGRTIKIDVPSYIEHPEDEKYHRNNRSASFRTVVR